MSTEPVTISSTANVSMIAELCVIFEDGCSKYLTIREGDIIRDLEYKNGSTVEKIDGLIKIINFNSSASNSAAIQPCLEKSTSVFASIVKPVSLVIDTSETFKADVVNIPIANILNFKGDRYVNEQYQGTVYEVNDSSAIASAISNMSDGDTLLIDAGVYDAPINVTKAIRITSKKDDQGYYQDVTFTAPITFAAPNGKVEMDHITMKDITSAEGTGPDKNTAKGCGIAIDAGTEVSLHDNTFANFNNFYQNIKISSTDTKVSIVDNVFEDGMSYHVIEAADKVKSGLEIKRNKFGNICKHNIISFYDYEDNANIFIEDNFFEYSANAVRISNIHNVNASFLLARNVYASTDDTSSGGDPRCSGDSYAGLVILQDYTGSQDFSKITIEYVDNYYEPDEAHHILIEKDSKGPAQPYYVWIDNAAWTLTFPTVIFNN